MKTATAAHLRAIDQAAITDYGIPGIVLMENAGSAVAAVAESLMPAQAPDQKQLISIVCGAGNNAGDGFVVGRHLHNHGFRIEMVLLREPALLKGDARTAFTAIQRMKLPVRSFGCHTPLTEARLIIDALLGTGTRGDVTGAFRAAIEAINAAQRPVLAIDIPSGIDADTGQVLGVAVAAHTTVTLCVHKPGLLTRPGAREAGNIICVDIGIPVELLP
jgi:NAD(P)H-hydrate epimerase